MLTDDIKPAIKAAIESEFENVGYDPSSAVGSRKCKGESDTGVGPVGGGVIPRIDLATALDKDILMKMGNQDGKTAWKERKAAVEQVIRLLFYRYLLRSVMADMNSLPCPEGPRSLRKKRILHRGEQVLRGNSEGDTIDVAAPE